MAIEQTAAGAPETGTQGARMIIGGKPVDAADAQTFELVNPADGVAFATAPLAVPCTVASEGGCRR